MARFTYQSQTIKKLMHMHQLFLKLDVFS